MESGKLPIGLLDGEQIVEDIKPLPALKRYYFIMWSLGCSIACLFGFFTIPLIPIAIILCYVFAGNAYDYRHYWITNKRIIFKRGILGYKISSIPLERISDVVVSRTFWENQFGFGSVRVQSLAGQISPYKGGSEGDLAAVPDPEKTQQTIFKLLSLKRKQEGLTM